MGIESGDHSQGYERPMPPDIEVPPVDLTGVEEAIEAAAPSPFRPWMFDQQTSREPGEGDLDPTFYDAFVIPEPGTLINPFDSITAGEEPDPERYMDQLIIRPPELDTSEEPKTLPAAFQAIGPTDPAEVEVPSSEGVIMRIPEEWFPKE